MEFEKKDVLAGAFVLGALAVALMTAVALNYERLTARNYRVELRLPNIAGIEKGTDVMYKGYAAGSVDLVTVAYEPELQFVVRLAIRKTLRLKEGTAVAVRNKGFGGAKYLELSVPEGERPMIEDGAVLPTTRDTDLMSKANEVMGEIEKAAQGFRKEGTAQDIMRAFKRADAALAKLDVVLTTANQLLAENRAPLNETISHARGLSARGDELLAKKDAALLQTIDHLNQASAHLPAIMANLEEFSADIKKHPWRLIRKGEAPAEPKPSK